MSPLPQHVVFFVLRAIDWIVPDVPESLELKIKRERYLAKQALAENQEALLVSRGQGAAPATPGTSSPGQWNMGHTRTMMCNLRSLKTCRSSSVIITLVLTLRLLDQGSLNALKKKRL